MVMTHFFFLWLSDISIERKKYCTDFLVGHCHLQIPPILATDSVMKEKISFHHKLYFLFFNRKNLSNNGKNSIMTVGGRECLSLYIQTSMSSTVTHLQSLPDLKNNRYKCQYLKMTMVVLSCCFILADIGTEKLRKY